MDKRRLFHLHAEEKYGWGSMTALFPSSTLEMDGTGEDTSTPKCNSLRNPWVSGNWQQRVIPIALTNRPKCIDSQDCIAESAMNSAFLKDRESCSAAERDRKLLSDGASRPPGPPKSESSASYVTSAVGLEKTSGRLRARRSSLFTQTIIWVTGLVCLAFLLGALAQAWSNNQLMQNLRQAQQETQQLQNEHNTLTSEVRHYQDPYVIESEARQQLGYARPGEHVVIVSGDSSQSQTHIPTRANGSAGQNFWQAWWNLFFGNG